jgi:hypothetical protein
MLVLIAIASLAGATPHAANDADCPVDYRFHHTAGAAPHRLDRLPRADLLLTVYREIDKCPAPVIVRSDIGNAGAARRDD